MLKKTNYGYLHEAKRPYFTPFRNKITFQQNNKIVYYISRLFLLQSLTQTVEDRYGGVYNRPLFLVFRAVRK